MKTDINASSVSTRSSISPGALGRNNTHVSLHQLKSLSNCTGKMSPLHKTWQSIWQLAVGNSIYLHDSLTPPADLLPSDKRSAACSSQESSTASTRMRTFKTARYSRLILWGEAKSKIQREVEHTSFKLNVLIVVCSDDGSKSSWRFWEQAACSRYRFGIDMWRPLV